MTWGRGAAGAEMQQATTWHQQEGTLTALEAQGGLLESNCALEGGTVHLHAGLCPLARKDTLGALRALLVHWHAIVHVELVREAVVP